MKHFFKVIINEHAAQDIQKGVDFYNEKQDSLGTRFYTSSKATPKSLNKDALLYQIKYSSIRCVKVNNFPYLIHYSVNQKSNTVRVYSVIPTRKDPHTNWVR
ncbi:hypothetical protein ERX46_05880 [Brumimicrobium glaciale]|uniref:Type II toxin-antitoxin system RelE/ParE family toxin n=1 Tax=Brumimicrobium glaciale TaxID=200475 RepID=A0A4Q4KQS1_9FLAO|nr:hypothetical protein [Brumimicrobium glaciale]RYM34904.1 hypothetical protein ERX46_05880 [Brumimicrobium glaciale]